MLTQTNLAQVQAAAQVMNQANQLAGKRVSNQAAVQLSQLPQVVTKVTTPINQRGLNSSQLTVTQTTPQQLSITQTGQVVTQPGTQVAGMVQLPSGVVQLNNMPIVVRPPPPKEMRNKSIQCKPSDDEDQRDIDRMEEAVTGKSKRDSHLFGYSPSRCAAGYSRQ